MMKNLRLLFSLLIVVISITHLRSQVNVTASSGTPAGMYTTVKDAFDAINAGTHQGIITLSIEGNTTETVTAALNASGTGSALYTNVSVVPSGGAARSITGAIAGPLIELNGADNVTFDGLNTGGNSLTLENTSTSNLTNTSTLRLVNDASGNTITNCSVLGASSSISYGTIFFSTGTATGNDNNIVSNCIISNSGANFPVNGICSIGTTSFENSGNSITDNQISNYFNAGLLTVGILVGSNNTAWSITNNRLFQTATRTFTTANTHRGIQVLSGSGYTINNNTIGYATSGGTGYYSLAGTIATRFIAIELGVGTAAASNVNSNIIDKIKVVTSSGAATTYGVLCGISVTSGNVNIGRTGGNTIGAFDIDSSLIVVSTTTQALIAGIHNSSTGTISIENNLIGGFRTSGITASVAGAVYGINNSAAATSLSILNNTIGSPILAHNMVAGTNSLTTGSSLGAGITLATSAPASYVISGNTIQNITSYGTGTSGLVRGINITTTATSGAGSYEIANNTIKNLTTTGALVGVTSGNIAAAGINFGGGTSNCLIHDNEIFNIAAANSTAITNIIAAGISHASATSSKIYANKIYNISNSGVGTTVATPPCIAGIIVRSGTTDLSIYNNMISLGGSSNSTLIGIWSNGGSTPNPLTNIYHNTVYIDGTVTSGALFTFGFLRGDLSTTARTQTVDVRNNIFVNNRTGGTGQHFAISNNYNATTPSATGWAANASNYNVLNANASTLGYWTTAKDFASWKTTSLSDQNSFSGIATSFVNTSTGDLHLNIATPSLIESGGATIAAVLTDIDGENRPGPAGSVNGGGILPDIGADEFDGIPLDASPPNISFSDLSLTCSTGNRSLENVSITDVSGVPTTGPLLPRVYYAKKPVGGPLGTWFSQAGTLSSGTAQNGTWSFNIVAADMGGLSASDSVFYYVIAQDIVPTPNISSNPAGAVATDVNTVTSSPSNPKKYIIANNLSGSYTVGAAGVYPTLTAAVTSYNNSCLSGPVVFNLIDATYSASEAFPISINNNSYASSTNTLTIKPNTTAVITGSVGTGSLLKLNGADYIIVDGSNSGGTDRSLTIQNTTTTTTGNAAVWLASPALGNGANNNTIKNCIIEGNAASTTYIGVNIGGSTTIAISASPGSELNNNNSIDNNLFRKTQYGVAMFGYAANAPDQNNSITNNNFGTMVAGEGHFWMGITADRQDNLIVSGNEIQNIVNNTSSTTLNICGIRLLDFKNGKAFNNNIHDISYTSTSTPKLYGIYVQSSTYTTVGNPSNALVYNNTISKLNSTGTSGTWNMTGILASSGNGDRYYHNSVHLTGQLCNSSSGLVAAFGHGDGNVSTFCNNVDVRNNIFNLEGSSATAGGNFWALYSRATSLSGSMSDYNLLRCAGTNATNNTGRVNSANFVTLSDWQTATTLDLNSVTTTPVFASVTDLHLPIASNVAINNLGTPLAAVTTDIDGETRDASNPDMGADEFIVVSCSGMPVAGSISPINATRCANETYTMTATGVTAGLGITYQWKTGPSGGPYMNVTGGTGATSTSYTTDLLTPGTFYYVLETSCTNSGLNATTNEFTLTVNPNPSAIISPAGPTTICAPSTQLYTASTNFGDTYRWKKNGSNIGGANSSTYTANSSGNYQIVVSLTSTGCKDSSAVSILSVNDAPTTSISATPTSICTGENSQLNVTGSSLINKYAFAAGIGSTLDPMAGATSVIGTSNDDTPMAAPANIGFTFNYNGTDFTQFSASPDGWILFGSTVATSQFTNSTTSTTNVPKLYPFWDDLATGADGGVETLLTGVAPNRIFIVQWRVTIPRNLTGAYNSTFQAWMYEGSNKIEFRYGTMGTPSSGTISGGLSAGGTNFQSLTFNSNSVSTTTANDVNTIAPPSGTIYTFDPGPFNYNWSPAGNLNASNIANPLASALTSTTKFFVTVTNSSTTCTKLDSVTVNVSSGPSITTQPAAVSGCLGSNAVFNVVATGAGLTYQWKKDGNDLTNGGNIAGATTNMLTVSGLTGGDAGIYTVVVTSTCGSPITSDGTSMLTVNPNPTAGITPTGTNSICDGETQSYTSTTDIGNTFSWKRNGNIIGGATSSSYNATLSGDYKVIVSIMATGCKDSSAVSTLVVNPNPSSILISPSTSDGCNGSIIPLEATGGILNFTDTIGTGTSSNTLSTPYKGFWGGHKVQFLYTASELMAAGLATASQITTVGMSISTFTSPYTFNGFTIAMKNTSSTALTATLETGTSTVLNPTNYVLSGTAPFNVSHNLNTPFTWDGTSNLIVEYCFNNNNGGGVSGNSASVNSHTAAGNYTSYYSADNTADVCSNPLTATTSTTRPNITLSYTNSVSKVWSPATGLYTDAGATIAYLGENLNNVYAKPSMTTNYTVTATSLAGCTSSASVNIAVTADEVMNENNDGVGSLRKAIECTAAGDTVFVSSGSVNLINLLTQLSIGKELLIIDDNGSPVMLKFDFGGVGLMNETNGAFKVGTMGNVTLDNIHIKQVGNDATHPIVKNEGILTLKNSKITGETGNTILPVVQNATGATINAEGSSEIKSE